MENGLMEFGFDGKPVRIVMENGEPRWVAKDVSEVLEYTWNGTARIEHVPPEWRGVTSVVTPSGVQDMAVLTEQGLYFFLGRSDKPKALLFQKWLAGEVVPSIRKNGMYVTPALLDDPEHLLQVTQRLVEERRARLAAEAQVKELAPKAAFADTCLGSNELLLVREVAKIASKRGLKIGQNQLYDKLRDWGLVMQGKTEPYQTAINAGYFEVIERPYDTKTGTRLGTTTKVTPKGQEYILNRLHKEREQKAVV